MECTSESIPASYAQLPVDLYIASVPMTVMGVPSIVSILDLVTPTRLLD